MLLLLLLNAWAAWAAGFDGRDEGKTASVTIATVPRVLSMTTNGGLRLTVLVAIGSNETLRLRLQRSMAAATNQGLAIHRSRCQFVGKVAGVGEHSFVSVGLCDGMSGFVAVGSRHFSVSPILARNFSLNSTTTPLASMTPKEFGESLRLLVESVEVVVKQEETVAGLDECEVETPKSVTRTRRSLVNGVGIHSERVKHRTVEILFVTDSSIQNHRQALLDDLIFNIVGIAQFAFRDPKLHASIDLHVSGIRQLNQSEEKSLGLDSPVVVSHILLGEFNSWLNRLRSAAKAERWDVAVLITRKVMFRKLTRDRAWGYGHILGITTYASVCSQRHSGIVLRERGLQTGFTLAHELGHGFNMLHDEAKFCSRLNSKPSNSRSFVMGTIMLPSNYPWIWSECSRVRMEEFFRSPESSCTLSWQGRTRASSIPRAVASFTADEQCRLTHGVSASLCRPVAADSLCNQLRCCEFNETGGQEPLWVQTVWAPGTECGNGKICQSTKCVSASKSSVNGGWSSWSVWSDCNSNCGGGVAWRRRVCDSPRPRRGGKFCRGDGNQAKTCNRQPCTFGLTGRDLQCRSAVMTHYGVGGVAVVPSIHSTRQCSRLLCVAPARSSRVAFDGVADGTPCHPFASGVCISGQCAKAGCDGQLGSDRKFDRCGECGGRGDGCFYQEKVFVVDARPDNVVTLRIHAGASNFILDILYRNDDACRIAAVPSLHSDHNQFVDSERGWRERELWGAWVSEMQQPFSASSSSSSSAYPGSSQVRVTGRISSDGLFGVTCSGGASSVHVRFRGRRPRRHLRSSPIGDCSSECSGRQRQRLSCDTSAGETDLAACGAANSTDWVACNLHCQLVWRVTPGRCDSRCGAGWAPAALQCLRRDIRSGSLRAVAERRCTRLRFSLRKFRCQGLCQPVKFRWGPWSPCSATCGSEGVKSRAGVCADASGVTWPAAECDGEAPSQRRKCQLPQCPVWSAGNWTHCICSRRQQFRFVQCLIGNQSMPQAVCSQSNRPISARRCRLGCRASWRQGRWGECECQSERQERRVWCEMGGKQAPSAACPASARPISSRACSCIRWRYGNWSDCSATCRLTGRVWRTRRVECVGGDGTRGLPAAECLAGLGEHEPTVSECQTVPECRAEWLAGNWTECLTSCGSGIRLRHVECRLAGEEAEQSDCDLTERPPVVEECQAEEPCKAWQAGDWGSCSQTCGSVPGVQTRSVECRSTTGEAAADCEEAEKPPTRRACGGVACPTWRAANWTECFGVCGVGTRWRAVDCVWQGQRSSRGLCQSGSEPVYRLSCHTGFTCDWVPGAWSACSVTCGGVGRQVRSLRCERNRREVPAALCSPSSRPASERACGSAQCPRWRPGPWSSCSATCGSGSRRRVAVCTRGNSTVPDRQCQSERRPHLIGQCFAAPCPYQWRVTALSDCSATCGRGRQVRRVFCSRFSAEGWPDVESLADSSACDSASRPSDFVDCNVGDCGGVARWRVGEFGDCVYGRGCGVGGRNRTVECVDASTGELTPATLCPSDRPNEAEVCPDKPCLASSCRQLRRLTGITRDGEYRLLLGKRTIKVFCFNMSGADPLEFLTLRSDRMRNFAVMHSLQLISHTGECPTNRSRLRMQDCSGGSTLCRIVNSRNTGFNYGATSFRKVRLLLPKLQIDVKNFAFAKTWASFVPFAQAGDCFSRHGNCSIGQFSVDLSGTDLAIDTSNRWLMVNATEANIQISGPQSIRGVCGGFCGLCTPIGHLLQLKFLRPT